MQVLKSIIIGSLMIVSTVYAGYAPEPSLTPSQTPKIDTGSVETKQNEYSTLIQKYADKWQISPSLTASIIYCESSNNRYALNDTPGVEFSVGLVQINLLAHKNITREQAEDPDFAINFAAENIAKGKADKMWVNCYRKATQ